MKTTFPNLHDANEAKIIDTVIDYALREQMTVSVFDGEEWVVKSARDRGFIADNIGTTDETQLRFRWLSSGKSTGWMLLIHGNGEDVISDFTDNEEMDALWEFVKRECGL